MARRLEGREFFTDYNNGVRAIASAEVVRAGQKHSRILAWFSDNVSDHDRRQVLIETAKNGLAHIPSTPIFTFTDSERVSRQPWFTGDHYLWMALSEYIGNEGGRIREGLFVPFSNGAEMGVHGPEAMHEELRFVTTDEQFRDTFGIAPKELHERLKLVPSATE